MIRRPPTSTLFPSPTLFRSSAQGLGVANYGGLTKTYLVGDWCTGRLFGVAWDGSASKWQMQEFMQTQLQFTAGNVDRSEEHTSELQSQSKLGCRLLLGQKKK